MRYLSQKNSDKLDRVLIHKIWGFPIFLTLMWFMFFCTFNLGKYPQELIQLGVSELSALANTLVTDGMFKDLLIDGIINGLGSVIVFLPNILILFLFIAFFEDSGYMPRASGLMNGAMSRLGLSGQSFMPLIMGFGCNVPAILSTQTISNRRYRLMTVLINPFMSCSARLPVYILIIGAFFPDYPIAVLSFIYLFGIIMAALTALLLKAFIMPRKKSKAKIVRIYSPYNIPSFKQTLSYMWEKTLQYLKKIGGVVLVAVIIIWALNYFPRENESSGTYNEMLTQIDKMSFLTPEQKKEEYKKVKLAKDANHQSKSYLGRFGHFVEPVMRPLGFDWKMSIALMSGLPAKEFVVSTLGVLYQVDGDNPSVLISRLQNEMYVSGPKQGTHVFTKPAALSFLIFVLLYFPCIGSIAAIHKELNGRWAAFSVVYTTSLAWLMSFLVYRLALFIF